MTASQNSHRSFHTTRWSIVHGAGRHCGSAESRRAMEELCEQYWPPLYAFLRRQGFSPSDSEDTVQGFFTLLLQRDDLGGLSATDGRFRAFLLASLKHFLSNQRDFTRAIKRGGRSPIISLDGPNAEAYVAMELTFDPDLPSYAEVAKQFELTEGAIKMTVSRMRKQYRDILRSEIAQTVVSPQEIEEEIQHLISVLNC